MDPIWLGRVLAEYHLRILAVEQWQTSKEAVAKALLKRITMLCAVVSLAVLANAFPNTTVAKYADQFRVALMRR